MTILGCGYFARKKLEIKRNKRLNLSKRACIASSPGHSQILSRSRGVFLHGCEIKSGSGHGDEARACILLGGGFFLFSYKGRTHNKDGDADVRDRSNSCSKKTRERARRMQALFDRFNAGTMIQVSS